MIEAICPQCERAHKAPDSTIGKRVTCKGCGLAFVVEEFDDSDTEEPVKVTRSTRDEREPRRSRVSPTDRKPNSSNKMLLSMGAGVLLLVSVGIGAYFALAREKTVANTPNTTTLISQESMEVDLDRLTSGWMELKEESGLYRIKFPSRFQTMPMKENDLNAKGYGFTEPSNGGEVFLSIHGNVPEPVNGQNSDRQKFDQFAEKYLYRIVKKENLTGNRRSGINFRGMTGEEFVFFRGDISYPGVVVVRFFRVNDRIIMLVAGGGSLTYNSSKIQGFLNSLQFEITRPGEGMK